MLHQARLAGTWYPDDAAKCTEAIERYAMGAQPSDTPCRAMIAPHAGWYYSGQAAARAYRRLVETASEPDVVVLFAGHRGPLGPHGIDRCDGWETPLGVLKTAHDLVAAISEKTELATEAMGTDHAAEVHMPMIRYFFPHAEIIQLGLGAHMEAARIGAWVGDIVAQSGRRAVFVGSTDLTHYGPHYRFEPKGTGAKAQSWVRQTNDRGFIDAVCSGDRNAVLRHANKHQSACCPGSVIACMAAVDAQKGECIDYYLSCDVQPSSSFVGYAGIAL